MKCLILVLSALIITEARNLPPGIAIFEILQNPNGINVRPVSTNSNHKPKHSKPKLVDNGSVNVVELLNQILSQLKQNEDDGGHGQGDVPLEENVFVDPNRGLSPQNEILLHLLAPKLQHSKNRNNLPSKSFPPILRDRPEVYDRTLPPRHGNIYAEDD